MLFISFLLWYVNETAEMDRLKTWEKHIHIGKFLMALHKMPTLNECEPAAALEITVRSEVYNFFKLKPIGGRGIQTFAFAVFFLLLTPNLHK